MFIVAVPDPPGQPRISDWDSGSVSLTWDRPARDGGSKIHGYRVEYREPVESNWRVANETPVKDNKFKGIPSYPPTYYMSLT